MKYKIAKKAYTINFGKIEEGYLYDYYSFVVYDDTRNKAKSKLLKKAYCENICLNGEQDEVTYLTIPISRFKEADKYFFEGSEMTLTGIEEELAKRKRTAYLDGILNDENIKYCYIIKSGYYKPNNCGYTDFKHKAGVYTKKKAVSSAKSCGDIRLKIINIEEHNKMIKSEIQDLNTRIIS